MKQILFYIFVLVFLIGCESEPTPVTQLVIRDGITYDIETNLPLTGFTQTLYDNGQLKSRDNYCKSSEDMGHKGLKVKRDFQPL